MSQPPLNRSVYMYSGYFWRHSKTYMGLYRTWLQNHILNRTKMDYQVSGLVIKDENFLYRILLFIHIYMLFKWLGWCIYKIMIFTLWVFFCLVRGLGKDLHGHCYHLLSRTSNSNRSHKKNIENTHIDSKIQNLKHRKIIICSLWFLV